MPRCQCRTEEGIPQVGPKSARDATHPVFFRIFPNLALVHRLRLHHRPTRPCKIRPPARHTETRTLPGALKLSATACPSPARPHHTLSKICTFSCNRAAVRTGPQHSLSSSGHPPRSVLLNSRSFRHPTQGEKSIPPTSPKEARPVAPKAAAVLNAAQHRRDWAIVTSCAGSPCTHGRRTIEEQGTRRLQRSSPY